MNEHADYYLARVPEPTTLLGLKLRPFSLGHRLLLHRIKSYFVGEDEDLGYEDLALSVLICSQTYEKAISYLDDPDLQKFMGKWADQLTGRGVLTRLGLKRLSVIPLADKAAEFASYMQRGVRKLSYSSKGEGRNIPLPDIQVIRVTLLRNFGGLTDEVLMDRPWGLCVEDYITIHTLDDNVTMYDASELSKARDQAKEFYEKMVAQGAIKPEQNGAN